MAKAIELITTNTKDGRQSTIFVLSHESGSELVCRAYRTKEAAEQDEPPGQDHTDYAFQVTLTKRWTSCFDEEPTGVNKALQSTYLERFHSKDPRGVAPAIFEWAAAKKKRAVVSSSPEDSDGSGLAFGADEQSDDGDALWKKLLKGGSAKPLPGVQRFVYLDAAGYGQALLEELTVVA